MYYLLRTVSFCLCLLPLFFVQKIAESFAFISFSILRVRHKVMLKNLDIVYNKSLEENQKKAIMWQSTLSFFYTVFECLYSPRLKHTANAKVPSLEVFDQKTDRSKGVFVIVGHMSNWEASGALVNKMITPSYAVVKKVGSDSVHKFVSFLRATNKFNTIEAYSKGRVKNSGSVVRQIFNHLNNGKLVGFPMDQYRPGDIEVSFFGEETPTNSMLAGMWLKRKVPVIGAYSVRKSFGVHELYFVEQAKMNDQWTKSDKKIITKQFNDIMEKIILECPEQYLWFHRRWKNVE